MALILVTPFDDVGDVGAEELPDALDRGEGVLDHVVEQARGDAHDVQALVRQDVGNLKRMNEIRLAGMAHLALVREGREHVRLPQQLQVGLGTVGADLAEEILEADHGQMAGFGV